jgi:hypothetical protein
MVGSKMKFKKRSIFLFSNFENIQSHQPSLVETETLANAVAATATTTMETSVEAVTEASNASACTPVYEREICVGGFLFQPVK